MARRVIQRTADLGFGVRLHRADAVDVGQVPDLWRHRPVMRYSRDALGGPIVQATPDMGVRLQMQRLRVPADEVRCCIYDTFTDDEGTYLGDHKPEIGGPWVAQDWLSYYGNPSAWPQILGGAVSASGVEDIGWASAWAHCGPDVRLTARCAVPDVSVARAGISLWWSGQVNSGNGFPEHNGVSLIVLYGPPRTAYLLFPSVDDPASLALESLSPLDVGPFDLGLEMRGAVAHWSVADSVQLHEGTVQTAASPRPGVGFQLHGHLVSGVAQTGRMDYFRACPL